MDKTRILQFARKWLWLLLAFALIPPAAAAFFTAKLPRVYEASTSILVRPAQPGSGGVGAYGSDQFGTRTIAQLMTRRSVLERVIKELDLPVSVPQLKQQIALVPEADSPIIGVKVHDGDPQVAAQIANQLAPAYLAQADADQAAQYGPSLLNLQARINEVDKQIKQTQAQITELSKPRLTPEQQAALSSLQTRLAADSAAYSTLVRNYEELRAAQAGRVGTLTQLEPAVPPTRPIGPRVLRDALAALILGLFVGVGLALLVEYLDSTLKSEDDVRSALGLPTLGVLSYTPTRGPASNELVAVTAALSPLVEAYRGIRTSLLFTGVDEPVRTLVVTSSLPGEGKTRTAANLAVVMAQAGRRVILVDADLRRPKLPDIFRRIDTQGMTNMLIEEGNPSDFILPTEVPNLRLLCAGPRPLNPSEIVGSQRMQRLISYLRDISDLVIFDTPPLNAVTDPAVLAARVDGVVLVVHAGHSTTAAVKQGVEALNKVGARVLGVVLNKLKDRRGVQYYEYYQRSAERDTNAPVIPAEGPATRPPPVAEGVEQARSRV